MHTRKSRWSGVKNLGQEALKFRSSHNDDLSNEQNINALDQKDNVISMAHIFRAEENLGHTVIDPKDVENAHVGHSDTVVQHLFKTVKNYSIDDTKTEQSGGPTDQDLTTAGGFLKQGIQDPDAHEGQKTRKRAESDLRRISLQMEEESITRQLAELDIKIAESKAKIAELEEHMKDISDIQNMIEGGADFDGDSQDARGARRKISKILSRHGKSIEDYTNADGKIDTDKLSTYLARTAPDVAQDLQTLKEELGELKEQKLDLEQRQAELIGSNKPEDIEAVKELAQDASNSTARAALSTTEEDIAIVQENITANGSAPDEGMDLMAFFGFGDDTEEVTAEADTANNEDATQNIANANEVNATDRSVGSFAQADDEQSPIANIANNITSMFSKVTSGETTPSEAPAEATEDYTQQGLSNKTGALTV